MSIKQCCWRLGVTLCALVLIVLATVITFWFVIASDIGDLGGMYDVYRYFGPITFFLDFCIHEGEFPLWNPLTYCGMPMTGNPQSFLFYPPHLLRALLTTNPTPERSNISFAIMWGLHFIFMALCTYWLGRAHGLGFRGALAAGIAFAFSAIMIRRMGEYHFITTVAWLPLLLLLIKHSIDARDFYTKTSLAILAGLVLGLSIMGGYLQVANLMGFVPAVYALFYFLLVTFFEPCRGSLRAWLRPWVHNAFAMAVVFAVGAGVAAVTLLPAWELGAYSLRAGIQVHLSEFSDLWKWSPLDFYQKMVLYGGIKYEAETIRNAGIAGLLLAAAAFSHHNRRDVFLFAALYLILFECCFGPPLPIGGLLEKVTPFSLSAYSRAYDYALLPLSLLVGFGVDAMSRPMQRRGHGYARAVALLLLGFVLLSPVAEWMKEISYLKVNDSIRIIPALALATMLLTGLVPLPKAGRFVFGMLLIALMFSETYAWNQSFVPYLTRRKVRDTVEVKREGHAFSTDNFRETDPICNRFLYSIRFAMNGLDPAHLHDVRSLLSGPPREGPGLRGVQDWEPTRANLRGNMLFKRSFWLARQYATGPLPGKRDYFPSATTVFLDAPLESPIPQVERQHLPQSSISAQAMATEITEPATLFAAVPAGQTRTMSFTTALPGAVPGMPAGSAGAVHSALIYHYTSDTTAQIDVVFTQLGTDRSEMGMRHTTRPTRGREARFEVPLPDFPRLQARITVENTGQGAFQFSRLEIQSDPLDEDGLIRITSRTANTVALEVGPLEEHRILTFLDAYYPGWVAYLDGQPTPILRANEQFKAVVLPPGTHQVRFVFRHTLTRQALAISLATLVLALAGLLICWWLRMPGVASSPEGLFSLEINYDAAGRVHSLAVTPAVAEDPTSPQPGGGAAAPDASEAGTTAPPPREAP